VYKDVNSEKSEVAVKMNWDVELDDIIHLQYSKHMPQDFRQLLYDSDVGR